MREPYIDTEPVSAAPLKPGAEQDFRLIFDSVSPEWAGALPEMFLHLIPANDLRFRRGTDAPTIRVEGLTVAGG